MFRIRSTRLELLSQLSELRERLQRLESESAALRERLAGEAALRAFSTQIVMAAQLASAVGLAIEAFAGAMRVPLIRGRAGGLARARQALLFNERWLNGHFMAHQEREQMDDEIARAEYMRYAAGGLARAATAVRASDGTFLPRS